MAKIVKKNTATIKIVAEYVKGLESYKGLNRSELKRTLHALSITDFSVLYKEALASSVSGESSNVVNVAQPGGSARVSKTKKPMKTYSFQLPAELIDRLNDLSDSEMTSVSAQIRFAIVERLKKRGF